jgi:hypothetical protein
MVWHSIKKLNVYLPYDPVIFLGICLKTDKSYIYTKTFTQMLIAPFHVLVKSGNNPLSIRVGMDKQVMGNPTYRA